MVAAVTDLKNQLEKLEEQKTALLKEIDCRRAALQILCSCGKKHRIKDLDLLVTHWYVQPYGCTDGDYWNEGEFQFVCPKTKVINRLLFDDYAIPWNKRGQLDLSAEETFKRLYRNLFKTKKDTYGGAPDLGTCCQNNYYVDKHRTQFELPAVYKE